MLRNGEPRCQKVSVRSYTFTKQTPLTIFVKPATRVTPLLGYVLLVLALETVFKHRRGRIIPQSGGVTTVTVPPACLEIEDAVNSEFQRGDGSAWCVHFVHILQSFSPLLFTSATLLAVHSNPGR